MLQIAFGQAKYFIDNLSENVKRGLRQKLRRGEWPGWAPIGYINNFRTHTVEPDKEQAPLVKKLFEAYSTGKYSLKELAKLSLSLGLVSQRSRKQLAVSMIQRMLQNKFYIGLFTYKGELYEGKHPLLIDKATFDLVQRIIAQKSKPRKSKGPLDFGFRGVFTCGECGRTITAERHTKKSGLIFRYYRCTKKGTKCTQKYISEQNLFEQDNRLIEKVALSNEWARKMLAKIEQWKAENLKSSALAVDELKTEVNKVEIRLSKLLDAHLDGLLETSEFQNKKSELIEQKTALKQKIEQINRKGSFWLEPLKAWIETAHQAGNLISKENFEAKAELLKKFGSNRLLAAGKAAIQWENPWKILAEKKANSKWGSSWVKILT
jgi:hypothetical protein